MRLKLLAAGIPTATSPDGADPARPGRPRRTIALSQPKCLQSKRFLFSHGQARYNRSRMEDPDPEPPEQHAAEELPMLYCPLCSTRLTGRQCKLLCEKCGYFM